MPNPYAGEKPGIVPDKILINSIRIPPDPIHQKKPQHYTVAKKWQQKSPTVKVLFTIRQLQPKYEMQRDPGSFFG